MFSARDKDVHEAWLRISVTGICIRAHVYSRNWYGCGRLWIVNTYMCWGYLCRCEVSMRSSFLLDMRMCNFSQQSCNCSHSFNRLASRKATALIPTDFDQAQTSCNAYLRIWVCKEQRNHFHMLKCLLFSGGSVELGETSLEAGQRELTEETGIYGAQVLLVIFLCRLIVDLCVFVKCMYLCACVCVFACILENSVGYMVWGFTRSAFRNTNTLYTSWRIHAYLRALSTHPNRLVRVYVNAYKDTS
jgi:8-oxo-dGTP pyrophosphatase MutT (NUDIX family)